MDIIKDIKHKFNLKGLKVGDTFLGCNNCWFQYPPHTGTKPICPKCNTQMNLFDVTEKDINNQN